MTAANQPDRHRASKVAGGCGFCRIHGRSWRQDVVGNGRGYKDPKKKHQTIGRYDACKVHQTQAMASHKQIGREGGR
jgi:hypothetical protein